MVASLAKLGYEPLVVTSGGATSDRWAPEDATLVAEVPGEVEVHRVGATGEPEASRGARRFAERWPGVPEQWSRWWIDASYRLGLEVGTGVDLIYAYGRDAREAASRRACMCPRAPCGRRTR
jgi:hypothetical protein